MLNLLEFDDYMDIRELSQVKELSVQRTIIFP